MILKRDLLIGLDALTEQVVLQGEEIRKLQARVEALEPNKVKVKVKKPAGRPRKGTQPRDKSGKFAKK